MDDKFGAITTWKRRFLNSHKFTSVEDLLDASADPDNDAHTYVNMALQLRFKAANRKTIEQLHELRRVGATDDHWVKKFAASLWMLYSVERELCMHVPVKDERGFEMMTKRQRQMMSGTGVVRKRREPLKKQAKVARTAIREALRGKLAIIWMDNFNKQRYSKNPNEDRNACINGTVFATTPQPIASLSSWTGWPTVRQLCMRIDDMVNFVHRQMLNFTNDVRTLKLKALDYDSVRVPCDIRRPGATPAEWYPWDIKEVNIATAPGLVEAFAPRLTYLFSQA